MNAKVKIEQLTTLCDQINELSDLLVQVVDDGASIGFLPPMKRSEAIDYWDGALNPDVILFVAKLQGEIIGAYSYIYVQSKTEAIVRRSQN